MATMKMHIIIPAIASLALLAANPASARASEANSPQKAQIGTSAGGVSPSDYTCRTFANYAGRPRCRQIYGIPDHN
jgi:hypothetical protein